MPFRGPSTELWITLEIDTSKFEALVTHNVTDISVVEELKKIARAKLRAAAEILLSAMISNVPVDTGFLRDSLRIEDVDEDSVRVGTDTDYAIFTEYGTKYMTAQHWMAESLAQAETAINQTLSN
jgi:HK97 gp10 family phage protein